MTEMMIQDVRRKLTRMRWFVAVMIGVSCAGLWGETVAFAAIVTNLFVWACWLMSFSHELAGVRRLEMRSRDIEHHLEHARRDN